MNKGREGQFVGSNCNVYPVVETEIPLKGKFSLTKPKQLSQTQSKVIEMTIRGGAIRLTDRSVFH